MELCTGFRTSLNNTHLTPGAMLRTSGFPSLFISPTATCPSRTALWNPKKGCQNYPLLLSRTGTACYIVDLGMLLHGVAIDKHDLARGGHNYGHIG
jgi:hypothetical protein